MFRRRVKSAVLVDFDNIAQIVGAPFGEDAQAWLNWIEDAQFDPGGPRRRIVHKRVYWNDHNEARWRPLFEAVGFETFNCPSLVKSKKSEADLRIALDAQRIAFEQRDVEEFFIISTDTDFVALLNALADLDRRTIAAANQANSSYRIYKKHADFTITIQQLKAACSYRRPPPAWRRWFFWWTIEKDGFVPDAAKSDARRRGWFSRLFGRRAQEEEPETGARGSPELERAADIIIDIAKDSPGLPVARRIILRRLSAEMPEFRTRGARPFLGCNDYTEFLRAVARLRQNLRVHFYANGGTAISYRSDPSPDTTEPPVAPV